MDAVPADRPRADLHHAGPDRLEPQHDADASAAADGKGAVRCDAQGKTNVFLPAVARADAAAQQTRDLLGRVYHGSLSLLVSAMAQQQALTQAEIDELYALLHDMEEKQRHD